MLLRLRLCVGPRGGPARVSGSGGAALRGQLSFEVHRADSEGHGARASREQGQSASKTRPPAPRLLRAGPISSYSRPGPRARRCLLRVSVQLELWVCFSLREKKLLCEGRLRNKTLRALLPLRGDAGLQPDLSRLPFVSRISRRPEDTGEKSRPPANRPGNRTGVSTVQLQAESSGPVPCQQSRSLGQETQGSVHGPGETGRTPSAPGPGGGRGYVHPEPCP